jgi:hypothetical protein
MHVLAIHRTVSIDASKSYPRPTNDLRPNVHRIVLLVDQLLWNQTARLLTLLGCYRRSSQTSVGRFETDEFDGPDIESIVSLFVIIISFSPLR